MLNYRKAIADYDDMKQKYEVCASAYEKCRIAACHVLIDYLFRVGTPTFSSMLCPTLMLDERDFGDFSVTSLTLNDIKKTIEVDFTCITIDDPRSGLHAGTAVIEEHVFYMTKEERMDYYAWRKLGSE